MNRSRTFLYITTIVFGLILLLIFTAIAHADPSVRVETIALTKNRPGYYSICIMYPRFTPSSDLLIRANKHCKEFADTYFNSCIKKADESARGGRPVQEALYTLKPIVSIARFDLVSVYFDGYTFPADDVHGYQSYFSLNFGIMAGKTAHLTFSDVYRPNTQDDLRKEVYTRLRQSPSYKEFSEGVPMVSNPELLKMYVITPKAISFLIPVSKLTSSSINGPLFVVKIPFDELKPYLRSDGPLKPLLAAPAQR